MISDSVAAPVEENRWLGFCARYLNKSQALEMARAGFRDK
jgi:hypothetical protein